MNSAPPSLLNFSAYKCARRLGHILFERWDPKLLLKYKTFLYDITEPRYKQIKIGYQISKILFTGQSSVLKSDVPYCFAYILTPLCCKKMGLNLKDAQGCHL